MGRYVWSLTKRLMASLTISSPVDRRCAIRQAVSQRDGQFIVAPKLSSPLPFQGGYADFIKFESTRQPVSSGAPPRSSMFDDLLFYHSTHAKYLCLTGEPRSAAMFAQKIVASECMMVLHYHRCLLATLVSKLSRRDRFKIFNSFWVEQAWSDLSSCQRRLDLLYGSIGRAMDGMGISRHEDVSRKRLGVGAHPWMDTTPDFLYIEAGLLSLRQVAERLLGSFDSIAGLVATRQSLHEARSVGTLTRLAWYSCHCL